MTDTQSITLTLDRRLLAHPRAYHLRRMRAGLWLYLVLLARRPAGTESFEVDPAAIGQEMGLSEGTVRSWLGHLRKGGYLGAERYNGTVRLSMKLMDDAPSPEPMKRDTRFFSVTRLERALGEKGNPEALQAALGLYADRIIKRALAGALAVPAQQIRRSRTALFLYLLKHHDHDD